MKSENLKPVAIWFLRSLIYERHEAKNIQRNQKFFITFSSACIVFGKNQIRSHRLKIEYSNYSYYIFNFLYIQRLYNRRNIKYIYFPKNVNPPPLLPQFKILKSVGTTLLLLLAQIFMVLFRVCKRFTSVPGVTMEICVQNLSLPWPGPSMLVQMENKTPLLV